MHRRIQGGPEATCALADDARTGHDRTKVQPCPWLAPMQWFVWITFAIFKRYLVMLMLLLLLLLLVLLLFCMGGAYLWTNSMMAAVVRECPGICMMFATGISICGLERQGQGAVWQILTERIFQSELQKGSVESMEQRGGYRRACWVLCATSFVGLHVQGNAGWGAALLLGVCRVMAWLVTKRIEMVWCCDSWIVKGGGSGTVFRTQQWLDKMVHLQFWNSATWRHEEDLDSWRFLAVWLDVRHHFLIVHWWEHGTAFLSSLIKNQKIKRHLKVQDFLKPFWFSSRLRKKKHPVDIGSGPCSTAKVDRSLGRWENCWELLRPWDAGCQSRLADSLLWML